MKAIIASIATLFVTFFAHAQVPEPGADRFSIIGLIECQSATGAIDWWENHPETGDIGNFSFNLADLYAEGVDGVYENIDMDQLRVGWRRGDGNHPDTSAGKSERYGNVMSLEVYDDMIVMQGLQGTHYARSNIRIELYGDFESEELLQPVHADSGVVRVWGQSYVWQKGWMDWEVVSTLRVAPATGESTLSLYYPGVATGTHPADINEDGQVNGLDFGMAVDNYRYYLTAFYWPNAGRAYTPHLDFDMSGGTFVSGLEQPQVFPWIDPDATVSFDFARFLDEWWAAQ